MVYFCKVLATSSATDVLNKYIFSAAYNVNANLAQDQQQPALLDRFLAGIVHPLIHVGYGVEYGIIQQIADGLAHTAIHPAEQDSILPAEFFSPTDPLLRGFSSSKPAASRPPFLSFVAQLLTDSRLTPAALKLPREDFPAQSAYAAALKSGAGEVVKELTDIWYDAWTVGVSDQELEDRLGSIVEDVLVGSAVMYGVAGYAAKGDRVFNADFFGYVIRIPLLCSIHVLTILLLGCTLSRRPTSSRPFVFALSALAHRHSARLSRLVRACCSSAHISPASQFGSSHDRVQLLPRLSPRSPHSTLRPIPCSRCHHLRTLMPPVRRQSASFSTRTSKRPCLRARVPGPACSPAPHRTRTSIFQSSCAHSALPIRGTVCARGARTPGRSRDPSYSTGHCF